MQFPIDISYHRKWTKLSIVFPIPFPFALFSTLLFYTNYQSVLLYYPLIYFLHQHHLSCPLNLVLSLLFHVLSSVLQYNPLLYSSTLFQFQFPFHSSLCHPHALFIIFYSVFNSTPFSLFYSTMESYPLHCFLLFHSTSSFPLPRLTISKGLTSDACLILFLT